MKKKGSRVVKMIQLDKVAHGPIAARVAACELGIAVKHEERITRESGTTVATALKGGTIIA